MDNDDLYDVPPCHYTPPSPSPSSPPDLPPSLPPKKSSKSLSFNEWDGLTSGSTDPRPRPLPRKTVRSSSSLSSKGASPMSSKQTPTTTSSSSSSSSSSPSPSHPQPSLSPSPFHPQPSPSPSPSPSAAPRPTPRPRPRRNSLKSPDLMASIETQLELPPSADEVEEMVNRMVETQLAQEEEAEAEERRRKKQQQQQLEAEFTPGRFSESSQVALSTGASSLGVQGVGGISIKGAAQPGCEWQEQGASSPSLQRQTHPTDSDSDKEDYENSETVKSLMKTKPTKPAPAPPPSQRLDPAFDDDDAFGALGSSNNDYAQVQKKRGAAQQFGTSFDPFLTPTQASGAPAPGLSLFSKAGGMLQPTKVWDNPAYAPGSGVTPGSDVAQGAGVGSQLQPEPSNSHRDSSPYEAVWYSKAPEERPGMVKPQEGMMTFTPKAPQDGSTAPQSCQPGYGQATGEYIELNPTYNIPPPSLPPPPLPPQGVLSSRPPSIPPRPAYRPAAETPPGAPSTLVFENPSSHLGESDTEGQASVSGERGSVFEALPTPGPGMQTVFDSDDPFQNSTFGSECHEFNKPLSSHDVGAMGDDEANVYEINDNDFVVEWPSMGADMENIYHEVGGGGGAGVEVGRSDSVRLSQVPPPPPRLNSRGHGQGLGEELEPPVVARPPRNTPSPRVNVYSLAHVADEDQSHSVDSSDSSEDLFEGFRNSGSLPSSGPISIVPSEQPRKTERYGYLYKQGGVKANRGWRMRWVVFNGKDLRYYDSNRSQISKKIIPLSSMKEVISDIREGDTNRFKFRLVTTIRDRTFLFAADTRDDCCTWTSTLMAAILKNKATGPNEDAEPEKPDKEGFIRFENNNKKFYVAIWGKTLCYYDTFEDFQMQCPVHEIDMKLSSVKDKKKNRLQLSTHYAHFSLVFDSPQEAQSWRMAIEDAIAEGLADDSVLEKVYENESNRICADCEDINPHWASINLGIVLCKKCAGIHRMFESSISKIRSLRMDTRVWTPSLIELMKAIGNGNANLFWEHDLLPIQKITKDSPPDERRTFAQLKYKQKRYSNQHSLAHDKRQLNEALLQVTSTSDLLEAMKIIFSGADLSYRGGPENQNAYQTAKHYGQRLLMELLYQNGGDCSSLDEENLNDEGRLREDVRLQGYLLKTGPAGRTFDQRWCVLEHGALTYYLNDKSTTAKDSVDRKAIVCLQEVVSDRQENVFEVSTIKSGNRVYTFAAENPSDRGMWMRTLGKLVSPVAVMEHVGMMDFSLAAQVFMRESVSEDWRQTWIMLSWRLLYFMNKDLKLDHIDLRKATQIKYSQSGSCPRCLEGGSCFVVSSPGQTFYIQATLQRDTMRILENVSASMKQSGRSLLDQQLTGDSVPVIVDKCLTQVLSRGQREQGIYRKAATHSRVENLIEELKKDAYAVRLDDFDIHEVANALKRFLRGLEDSLFMRERYNEWIRTSAIEDEHNKFLWYRYLLDKLPLVNYNTLRHIVLHIKEMAQYDNNMTIESLCTCFAPTLMCTENDPVAGTNAGSEIKVLLDLLNQRDYLFQINQEELDHEARIQEAARKIQQAHQDVRRSQPPDTFLMPVSMYSHNGQCEMVKVNSATTAQDVVEYLTRKCNLSGRSFALSEILFKGALVRPLFPSSNILMTTGRWGDWDENVRKEMCLCLTDTATLTELDKNYDNSRALFGEVRYADSKSKTKFKKVTVEFKQCMLTFYKDAKASRPLCSWKVEELVIYLGIDPKRSPPNSFGFTFVANSRDRSSCFGHCVSLPSEADMYRWVSALMVAQNPEGLLAWNM